MRDQQRALSTTHWQMFMFNFIGLVNGYTTRLTCYAFLLIPIVQLHQIIYQASKNRKLFCN